jgi:hypothetical protein
MESRPKPNWTRRNREILCPKARMRAAIHAIYTGLEAKNHHLEDGGDMTWFGSANWRDDLDARG